MHFCPNIIFIPRSYQTKTVLWVLGLCVQFQIHSHAKKLYLHIFDIADTAFSYENRLNRLLISTEILQGKRKRLAINLQRTCCVFTLRGSAREIKIPSTSSNQLTLRTIFVSFCWLMNTEPLSSLRITLRFSVDNVVICFAWTRMRMMITGVKFAPILKKKKNAEKIDISRHAAYLSRKTHNRKTHNPSLI